LEYEEMFVTYGLVFLWALKKLILSKCPQFVILGQGPDKMAFFS
jgi:hypothetical protein